jgi:hypothetical protein
MSDSDDETINTDVSTEEEFRVLFNEVKGQRDRIKMLAQKLGGESGQVLSEIDGTVLDLLQDVVAQCGAAFELIEDRLYNLEEDAAAGMPNDSFLLAEDAQQYVAYFEQIKRLLSELAAVPGAPPEQQEVFATLLRMTEDRIEFTQSISADGDDGGDDEGDDSDDGTPKEGEGVGEA